MESIKVWNIPIEEHQRWARETQEIEETLSKEISTGASNAMIARATQVLDTVRKLSNFDLLLQTSVKDIIHSEPPPNFFNQLRSSAKQLFGEIPNLESMIGTINTLVEGKEGSEKESANKIVDAIQKLIGQEKLREVVYSRIASLRQG